MISLSDDTKNNQGAGFIMTFPRRKQTVIGKVNTVMFYVGWLTAVFCVHSDFKVGWINWFCKLWFKSIVIHCDGYMLYSSIVLMIMMIHQWWRLTNTSTSQMELWQLVNLAFFFTWKFSVIYMIVTMESQGLALDI